MDLTKKKGNKIFPVVLQQNEFDIVWRGDGVKPDTVRSAIEEYITTIKTWGEVCELFGISRKCWARIQQKHPEMRASMIEARKVKADIYNEASVRMYQEIDKNTTLAELPEWLTMEGKFGMQLSPAGVKLLKDKADVFNRQAQILERGQYNDKYQIETDAVVNSQSIEIDMQNIMAMDITELAEIDTMD